MNTHLRSREDAQKAVDRIRLLREQLDQPELQNILDLTPEQRSRFERWASASIADLSHQFDVDTSDSQKRMSWGMRIASTLGGLALCAAVVLFFMRFWGFLGTPSQVVVLMFAPLAALAGTEFAARRERTMYFAGVMALVALTAFILNLAALGQIFNIVSTQNALFAWGAFAALLAYRYGLRLMLAIGLVVLICFVAATFSAELGYNWLSFGDRPEQILVLGALAFAMPLVVRHDSNPDFPAVYRLVGLLTTLMCVLSLAEWGAHSYLPFSMRSVERTYELLGLVLSAAAIWMGIVRNWKGVVNAGAIFFTAFLFCRLYHWLWDWMPKYLFFAIIGALGIALVMAFRQLRSRS